MSPDHIDPRLLDRFECEGYWWAPSAPRDTAPGTLSYDPRSGLHLELLGHLTPLERLGTYDRAEQAVIHGLTTAGRPVTLDGCLPANFQLRAPGIATERFYSQAALIGEHIAEPKIAEFPSCAVRLTNLEEWLSAKPFSVNVPSNQPPYALDVAFRAPAEITYALEHLCAQLTTTSSFQTHDGMPRHFGITAHSWLVFAPDVPRPLAWYMDAIAKLRNLIALCFGAPVYIEGFTLLGVDPPAGQERLRAEVLYAQNPSAPVEVTRPPFEKMGLNDFGDAAAEVVNAWFRTYDLAEPALNLFFAVLFGQSLYIDIRFLLLAQAMETLHRSAFGSLYISQGTYEHIRAQVERAIPSDAPEEIRDRIRGLLERGNEYSLRRRLAELDRGPLTKMGVARMDKRTRNKIVDTRNYYTHYSANLKDKAAHGQEIHDLIQLMTAAMTAILFDILGVAPEPVREWMKKSRNLSGFVG